MGGGCGGGAMASCCAGALAQSRVGGAVSSLGIERLGSRGSAGGFSGRGSEPHARGSADHEKEEEDADFWGLGAAAPADAAPSGIPP